MGNLGISNVIGIINQCLFINRNRYFESEYALAQKSENSPEYSKRRCTCYFPQE